ncbi:MAG: SoxR reducing system RseC family protein [Burkholderiales bacterium]
MIEAQARVVDIQTDGLAYVESQRKSACGTCKEAEGGCGTASLSKVLGKSSSSFKVLNAIEARVGDTVVVGIAEGVLLKTSLLIYLVPLFLLIFCALTARWVWGVAPGEIYVVLGSVIGLIAGFLVMRFISSGLANNSKFLPVILRQAESSQIVQFTGKKNNE